MQADGGEKIGRRALVFARLRVAAVAIVAIALLTTAAVPAARWLDRNVVAGRIRDTWGVLRWYEDWGTARPISPGLDRRWMASASEPLRIAHALGASGSPAENTMPAMEAAARNGFLLFEVDIWLDERGALRCHHGPAAPRPLTPSDCVLDRLLPEVAARGGWVILDIKTDFEQTGRQVIRLLRSNGLAPHAVFQLYRPSHTAIFDNWASELKLPSPIVTTYGAHRSVQHIADNLPRLRISALALPFPDRSLLQRRPSHLTVLLHPVHDCVAFKDAVKWGATGVFTLTLPRCQ